jgi:hypothetical protein
MTVKQLPYLVQLISGQQLVLLLIVLSLYAMLLVMGV